MRYYITIFGLIGLLLLTTQCANKGAGPQGGPRDTIPPVVVLELPVSGTRGFTDKKIEIDFDEYIVLDKITQNAYISPPQQQQPTIKAVGKKLFVVFEDTLNENTTYSIHFGEAIQDNNEKNVLHDYTYIFSTGTSIDSLQIAGTVLDAYTLNPVEGMVVGIHSNLDDSAFTTIPFTNIGKIDTLGDFTITNVAEGSYHLFALQENSKDYMYTPGEGVGWYDSLIIPSVQNVGIRDTFWLITPQNDTIIDTIVDATEPIYSPDDVLFLSFKEDLQRHFIGRVSREERHKFTFSFSAQPTLQPRLMDVTEVEDTFTQTTYHFEPFLERTRLQHSPYYDTITIWLLDSADIMRDTLCFNVTYNKTDSIYQFFEQTDTLMAVFRETRMSDRAREALEEKAQNRKVLLQLNIKSQLNFFDNLYLRTDYPLQTICQDSILLQQKKDTVWDTLDYTLRLVDTSIQMTYQIDYPWEAGEKYRLKIDSNACVDIYDHNNDAKTFDFKTRAEEDYATLLIKMAHYDSTARIQLLDTKENVVRELPADTAGAFFKHLDPKEYYLRLYMDTNGDSLWTTGNVKEHRQPERMYYFPKKLTLKANWDFEQAFDHTIPLIDQRPIELIKHDTKK